MIVGFDKDQHVYLGNLPMMARNDVGGASSKDLVHWEQLARSGKFQEYDYGVEANLEKYGSIDPPAYNIQSFAERLSDVELMFVIGAHDALVAPNDFAQLKAAMPEKINVINVADYNHLDYFWASDDNKFVNIELLKFVASLD